MSRTFAFIGDVGHVDLWVFDPTQSYVDEPKPLRTTALERVRGVTGVAWAAPLYKGLLVATLPDGKRQLCNVVGIDDDTWNALEADGQLSLDFVDADGNPL